MADAATLVVRVLSDVKDATKGLDDVASSGDRLKKGLGTAAKAATGVLLGLGAAAVVAGNAAAEDAQAQAILANTLRKTTGAHDDAIAGVEAFISSMSAATGVADDQLRPAMGNLLRATHDVTTSQDALKVALDVAAATGADVESVSKAIAKAYGGQTTSLGKLVPGMDAAILKSGDMNAIMAELAKTTGGSAAAAADTAAGKMAIMQNSMSEAKESIGAGLLPVMSKLADKLTTVGDFAQNHSTSFQVLATAIAAVAAATIATNAAMSVATAVTAIWSAAQLLANTTLGIRIGLMAIDAAAWIRSTAAVIVNTAVSIANVAARVAVTIATTAWAAASWLLAAAELAVLSPIGLIVIAILLLVAAIVLAWKHSETFRTVVLALWDAIKAGASAVASAVSTSFEKIRSAIETAFDWVKSNWPLIVAILTGPIGIAVALIIANWEKIKAAFDIVTNAIGNAWDKTVAGLKSAVSGLGAILSAPFDIAKAAIDAVKNAVDAVIAAVQNLIAKIASVKGPHIPDTALPGPFMVTSGAVPTVRAFGAPRVSVPVSRAATGRGAVTINVTGAIDPEATARQIERVLLGHGRRVGLAP